MAKVKVFRKMKAGMVFGYKLVGEVGGKVRKKRVMLVKITRSQLAHWAETIQQSWNLMEP